jgi:hypothetical protein
LGSGLPVLHAHFLHCQPGSTAAKHASRCLAVWKVPGQTPHCRRWGRQGVDPLKWQCSFISILHQGASCNSNACHAHTSVPSALA